MRCIYISEKLLGLLVERQAYWCFCVYAYLQVLFAFNTEESGAINSAVRQITSLVEEGAGLCFDTRKS